jgi:hypothetical protein
MLKFICLNGLIALCMLTGAVCIAQAPNADTLRMADTSKALDLATNLSAKQTRTSTPYTVLIGFDISRPLLAVIEKNYIGVEGMVAFGRGKTYLAAELGFLNRTLPQNSYDINTYGTYLRLGLEKNAFDDPANKLFYGMRLAGNVGGYLPLNIRINNEPFTGEQLVANDFSRQSLSAFWLEAVSGLQVEIHPHIQIGFTIRAKFKLNQSDYIEMPYNWLPGYGFARNNTSLGLNYYIIYQLSSSKR